jgi:hypothetical protein
MRQTNFGLTASVAAVALLLAAGASLVPGPAAASALRSVAASRPSAAGGKWGTAIEVPGTAALNTGGYAEITSVSCATPGNCSAGGWYGTGLHNGLTATQAFVVNQTGGKWGTAIEVPGTAALDKDDAAQVNSVSCASAGNCSAGGIYENASGHVEAFVVNETGGKWGTAIEVPGTAALDDGGDAGVQSVSCGAAGNCSAGGFYENASGHVEAFVVNETGGKWGTAAEVPGIAAINTGEDAGTDSVSCASAGNCSAGGFYEQASGRQVFVVSETGGKWGTAVALPGIAAVNRGGYAEVTSLSCRTAGNCSVGGWYASSTQDGNFIEQAFVGSQAGGKWATAVEVPGTAAVNTGGYAEVTSLSCGAAGNCSAGGFYSLASGDEDAFVVSETGGKWGTAIQVPGTAALGNGEGAQVYALSCASAGNCSAGGSYTDSTGFAVFVVSETGGKWGTATELPGIAALNTGIASVNSMSCASAGNCSAGGFYHDSAGTQAFVVSETSTPARRV